MAKMLQKLGHIGLLLGLSLLVLFVFVWYDVPTQTLALNDLYSDVFVYNQSSGLWSMKFGDGQGGFVNRNASWDPNWIIKPARFNNDDLTDFLVYNPTTGQWVRALNSGNADFTYFNSSWSPGWEVYVLDLNGDSLSDIFLYNPSSGQWFKAINVGAGDFSYFSGSWSPNWKIYPTRLNSDNLDDIFLYNTNSGQWIRAYNDGNSGFTYHDESWSPSWQIYPGDFNADGLSDFLLYSPTLSPRAILAKNNGTGFDYPFSANWDPDWTSINIGDFNSDGKADVFLYKAQSGVWVQAINNGSGSGFNYRSGTWDPNWQVFISEFNNDGRSDILVYNSSSKTAIPLLMNSSGQFEQKSTNTWGANQKIFVNRSDLSKPLGFTHIQLGSAPFNASAKFGIMYSLWHCPYSENNPAGNQIFNITEAIAGRQSWGPVPTFHWSSRPPLGYYCLSRDTNVLTDHATKLRDAGINFIFVDVTNHPYTDSRSDRSQEMIMDPFVKMLEVWSSTPGAPKIVLWVPGASGNGAMVDFLLSKMEQYPNMYFSYEGKPLILIFPSVSTWSQVADQLRPNYTVRIMLGLLTQRDQYWSFLQSCSSGFRESQGNQDCNQLVAYLNGKVEQVSVASAYQETHMSNKATAVPKQNGKTLTKQFGEIFNYASVPIVTFTSWNEWMAQRGCFDSNGNGALPPNCTTDQFPDGSKIFVDVYDQEYNRDIEPDTFHGDFYYQLMKQCITMYKNGQQCGVSPIAKLIDNLAPSSLAKSVKTLVDPESITNSITNSIASSNLGKLDPLAIVNSILGRVQIPLATNLNLLSSKQSIAKKPIFNNRSLYPVSLRKTIKFMRSLLYPSFPR